MCTQPVSRIRVIIIRLRETAVKVNAGEVEARENVREIKNIFYDAYN
jgi:hypothetical protein